MSKTGLSKRVPQLLEAAHSHPSGKPAFLYSVQCAVTRHVTTARIHSAARPVMRPSPWPFTADDPLRHYGQGTAISVLTLTRYCAVPDDLGRSGQDRFGMEVGPFRRFISGVSSRGQSLSHAGIVSTDPRPSNRLTHVYHRDITNDRDCPSQPSFPEPQWVRMYASFAPHDKHTHVCLVSCSSHQGIRAPRLVTGERVFPMLVLDLQNSGRVLYLCFIHTFSFPQDDPEHLLLPTER
ncbi:hypothetical protein B0T13DRAFT_128494 [Neurospora crassa]|nr:hypothetical protein B0T13DRAFT_128494 [Neurospora crassa]